ncbi:hypothetical protein, conserved [Eimeria tenella]|uniref:Uncharacterized protein n=1 Tax=Eimeria tenella TaxID=5802 RepID=U6L6L1_EIMTE|nr:hypothetical protein, conserved [Eimeria tenella]CDJ43410.1 hypothetical protein, conserved [Eimeria tenella]|eukprot:XP_013234160.1 hypothetical protein, conserved [Eimeria tenella]
MQMPVSAAKTLKSATVALCWACVVPDFLDQCGSQLATAGDFTGVDSSQSDEFADFSGATENIEYEGSFSLPADGADPFSRVSILRANAISLKNSHISSEMLQSLGELVQALIQEEAQNIQHQSDLWLISETKKAVDLLHNNPSLFPATGYSLHEGPNGVLFVKVSEMGMEWHFSSHQLLQTDVPYWMVDAEAALRVIVQDVMSDVMQMTLPMVSEPPPEEKETDFPIEFGYDSTDRRSIKFAFGDSTVTVTCGKTLQLGGAVGVSHGSYTVKVESGNNTTEGTINAGPVAVHSSVAPDNVQHDVSVGTMQVMQARINPSAGPGSIVASYQDARIKFDTNPEGKRHGAEVGNKDFLIGVTRDFDDRINIVKRMFNCSYYLLLPLLLLLRNAYML